MSSVCDVCAKEYMGWSSHDFAVESALLIQSVNGVLVKLPRTPEFIPLVERLLSFKEGLENTRLIQATKQKEE